MYAHAYVEMRILININKSKLKSTYNIQNTTGATEIEVTSPCFFISLLQEIQNHINVSSSETWC